MRLFFRLGVVAAVLAVPAVGFFPVLFAHGQLDGYARDAAQKGGSVLLDSGQQDAEDLARQAVAEHPGVHLEGIDVSGNIVQVSVSETVHTMLGNFHLSSTEGSYLGN